MVVGPDIPLSAPAGPDVNSRGRQPTVDHAPPSPALKGPNSLRPHPSPAFDPSGVGPRSPSADRGLAPTAIHVAALRAVPAATLRSADFSPLPLSCAGDSAFSLAPQRARQRFGLRQPSGAYVAASASAQLGSAPASGAADGGLAVRPGRSGISRALGVPTPPCSPRGRVEQQPGRLRSPAPQFMAGQSAPAGPDVNSRGRQPTVDRAQLSPALKGPNSLRPHPSPAFDPSGVGPVPQSADRGLAPTAIHVAALRAVPAATLRSADFSPLPLSCAGDSALSLAPQRARQRFGLRQPSGALASLFLPACPAQSGGGPPHSKTLPCKGSPPRSSTAPACSNWMPVLLRTSHFGPRTLKNHDH
jgi:hypothetical protein